MQASASEPDEMTVKELFDTLNRELNPQNATVLHLTGNGDAFIYFASMRPKDAPKNVERIIERVCRTYRRTHSHDDEEIGYQIFPTADVVSYKSKGVVREPDRSVIVGLTTKKSHEVSEFLREARLEQMSYAGVYGLTSE